jgi:hypothetical protein
MSEHEKTYYPGWMEWDFLQNEYKIDDPSVEYKLAGSPELIKIWRDDDYRIKGRITGTTKYRFYTDIPEKETGLIIPPFEIKGSMHNDMEKYDLSGCYILGTSTHGYWDKPESQEFETDLSIHKIRVTHQAKKEINSLIEWYLNGVDTVFFFNRGENRKYRQIYTKEKDILKEKTEQFENELLLGWDRYTFIKCVDFGFIINSVPKPFGPRWSNNLSIEYRPEFCRIPNIEERIAVSEIVSFILGKQMFNVGYSTFDKSGYFIDKVAQNPWSNIAKYLSQKPPFFPINLKNYGNECKIESILPSLVKKYFDLKDVLKLSDVLWRYWIGRELPLGSDIPIIANGIEILANNWFKSNKSHIKGVYIPYTEYKQIANEEIEKISVKLGEHPHKKKIISKLSYCYNMSSNDRLNFFFNEIGLEIGSLEREAIDSRNVMIHDSFDLSSNEYEKLILLSLVYKVFFHRVILKVLDYSGEYIDYSMKGYPSKTVDRVIGKY